jgi:GT2 family glycosyltransferase
VTSMSDPKPLVSVIVLSYNRPECLRRALDSIARQSYANLEILVVDNKSESSDRIKEIVCNYPVFKLIQNSSNLGFSGGMNEGHAAASGDYVYLTLDDVVLEENCLLRLAEYMETDPASGLVAPILYSELGDTIVSAGGEFKLTSVHQVKFLGIGFRGRRCFAAVVFSTGLRDFARSSSCTLKISSFVHEYGDWATD